MAFHFGQVEVGTAAAVEQLARVVKEVEAEVEDGAGDGFAIDEHVSLLKMPAARADKERSGMVNEFVVLAGSGIGVSDLAADCVTQIDVAVEKVVPEGAARIFKVCHEDFGAGVEGVDDHFAINGAGDFDAAIVDVFGNWCAGPI